MEIEEILQSLIPVVRKNCDIADAKGSQIFSICGMALRLRDLNKWEKGLNPWEENTPENLVQWIDEKEHIWEALEDQKFENLLIRGKTYDPFDTLSINEKLRPFNLFYGAGYAHSLKPTFFVAGTQTALNQNGIPVLILGRELVRDLLTIPAMNQDGTVVIRLDAARLYLWDQMAYLKKSGLRFLHYALKQCGLPDPCVKERKIHFESILAVQQQTYLYHEIGEIKDTVFDHGMFRRMVAGFPHTTVELLVRTVKDLLADTGPNGVLAHLIATKNNAGLGFYAAFQDGLFRPLFPGLRKAVEIFVSRKNWQGIEEARQEGFNTASVHAERLMEIFSNGKDKNDLTDIETTIKNELVSPLLK